MEESGSPSVVEVDDEATAAFNDWEHLQSSPSSSSHHPLPNTPSPDDFSVFPPVNHEGLPLLLPHPPPSPRPRNLPSTPAPSPPPPQVIPHINASPSRPSSSPPPTSTYQLRRWLSLALHLFNSKVLPVFGSLRSFTASSAWSLRFPQSVIPFSVLLVLLLWVCRRRWRRQLMRSDDERIERLQNLIREKDGKIIQLLDQIAQMNKVLLSRYRVPVVIGRRHS